MKKQSFLHGAAILTVATVLIKILGAVYKIPLMWMLGSTGYGHFIVAFNIYNVLLMISTTGLPVAVSKLVAETQTLGEYNRLRKIFSTSSKLFLALGIVGTAMMLGFSKPLAMWMRDSESVFAIAALAPSVLFVCIMASYRGYFQGQSNMTPTAISQMIEAVSKPLFGLALVYIVLKLGYGVEIGAAGAIAGGTLGAVIGAGYIIVVYLKHNKSLPVSYEKPDSSKTALKRILAIAVPITVGSAGLQIINLLDTNITLARLQDVLGYTEKYSTSLIGLYGSTQAIFGLPTGLIVPLAISVIPHITSNLALDRIKGAKRVEESAIRITALFSLPCGVGLVVLAMPILRLIYSNLSASELAISTPLMAIQGVAVIFNCLVLLTNSILQAHGRVSDPIYTMFFGGIVKVCVNWFLVAKIGIVGAPIGTLICYILIAGLNIAIIRRKLTTKPKFFSLFVKPSFAAILMGGAAWLVYSVLSRLISLNLSCLCAVAAGGFVYLILVVALGIITKDDLELIPKGDKIQRLLRIK